MPAPASCRALTPVAVDRRRPRQPEIDELKGLAIVGVMAQHAFAGSALNAAWDTLHIGQAVPVLFVLLGLNASRSTRFGRVDRLLDYPREYWRARSRRFLVPFLLLWPLALIAGAVSGELHIGGLIVLGVYPLTSAPGNYFVTILFEFAVVWPAVLHALRRRPGLTIASLIALDVGFELVAPHIGYFTRSSVGAFLYAAALPKYLVVILAGIWLGRRPSYRPVAIGLAPLAVGSVVYLIILHEHPADFTWLENAFSRSTNFISASYAVWLTCVGLAVLPRRSTNAATRRWGELGQASYHIFLVQIVWFGVTPSHGAIIGIAGIVGCSIGGLLFWRFADEATAMLSRSMRRLLRSPL